MSIFDDILGNQDLGDDLEVTIGDKTLKVGDIRSLRAEAETNRRERDAYLAERDSIRGERDNLTRSVTDLLGQAGRMADADQTQQPTDPAQILRDALLPLLDKEDPNLTALVQDKIFGKALTNVEERAVKRAMAENEELRNTVKELKGLVHDGFQGLVKAQVNEREQRWYDINKRDIPKGADGKPLRLEEIRNYASQRGLVLPGTQLVDYDSALEAITEPQRAEARMSEAEKRGYQKGLEDARRSAGKVLPIFGDRAGGSVGKNKIATAGKSQRQMVTEALSQGLADLASEGGE